MSSRKKLFVWFHRDGKYLKRSERKRKIALTQTILALNVHVIQMSIISILQRHTKWNVATSVVDGGAGFVQLWLCSIWFCWSLLFLFWLLNFKWTEPKPISRHGSSEVYSYSWQYQFRCGGYYSIWSISLNQYFKKTL